MGLNVQTIGRPGNASKLKSGPDWTYFIALFERGNPTSSSVYNYPLVAGEGDAKAGDACIRLTDLADGALIQVIDMDCVYRAEFASATGFLTCSISYADGGSQPTQTIRTQAWNTGCEFLDGAKLEGKDNRVLTGQRGDGWGFISVSVHRGGSNPGSCAGNSQKVKTLIRVATAKIVDVRSISIAGLTMNARKL